MNEFLPGSEFSESYDFSRAAYETARFLFAVHTYANLSEADLRHQKIIGEDETLIHFVTRELRLNESIQAEAYEAFCTASPPPVDTAEMRHWEHQPIFTLAEENEIRLAFFQGQSAKLAESCAAPEKLIQTIIATADAAAFGDSPADPTKFREYISKMELTNKCVLALSKIADRHVWGVKIPTVRGTTNFRSETGEQEPRLTRVLPEKILAITDPDQNAEITSLILKNPPLLRYFMKNALLEIQGDFLSELSQKFYDAAEAKIWAAKAKASHINNQARAKFFELLQTDTCVEPLEIISISRGTNTQAVWKGTAEPSARPAESDSQTLRFTVRQVTSHCLEFTWADIRTTTTRAYQNGKMQLKTVSSPTVNRALVRISEGTLMFKSLSTHAKTTEWRNDFGQLDEDLQGILNLFRKITLVTEGELLAGDPTLDLKVAGNTEFLLKTENSLAFTQALRQLEMTSYPAEEVIVNPGRRVAYVVSAELGIVSLAAAQLN